MMVSHMLLLTPTFSVTLPWKALAASPLLTVKFSWLLFHDKTATHLLFRHHKKVHKGNHSIKTPWYRESKLETNLIIFSVSQYKEVAMEGASQNSGRSYFQCHRNWTKNNNCFGQKLHLNWWCSPQGQEPYQLPITWQIRKETSTQKRSGVCLDSS